MTAELGDDGVRGGGDGVRGGDGVGDGNGVGSGDCIGDGPAQPQPRPATGRRVARLVGGGTAARGPGGASCWTTASAAGRCAPGGRATAASPGATAAGRRAWDTIGGGAGTRRS
ncbi:glycine-rich protein 23-like [Syzygium oleosum]|uniref:glycine-rich protein 23-like n=1 Tax=Syzygium oleosum TaxID=219896 RepID=UPI0024B96CC4|nr:glycine-rich protein 23-like [Syzygium oleosum]